MTRSREHNESAEDLVAPATATNIVTFGCRLNTYESEVMKAHAEKAGLGNTIIFNTCAVTNEAVRQARQRGPDRPGTLCRNGRS